MCRPSRQENFRLGRQQRSSYFLIDYFDTYIERFGPPVSGKSKLGMGESKVEKQSQHRSHLHLLGVQAKYFS